MILQSFNAFQVILDQRLADAIQTAEELRFAGATKEKKISQLEKEVRGLEKKMMTMEMDANKTLMEAVDDAKVCAARVILKAKISMAQQAMNPSFDRSEWDVAGWKERLKELGDYETPGKEPLPTPEEGPSGAKGGAEDAEAKGEAGEEAGEAGAK
jgi:outer membrane murein-binding lipoprotein Lpp